MSAWMSKNYKWWLNPVRHRMLYRCTVPIWKHWASLTSISWSKVQDNNHNLRHRGRDYQDWIYSARKILCSPRKSSDGSVIVDRRYKSLHYGAVDGFCSSGSVFVQYCVYATLSYLQYHRHNCIGCVHEQNVVPTFVFKSVEMSSYVKLVCVASCHRPLCGFVFSIAMDLRT